MYIELLENIFWMEFGLTGVISGIMGGYMKLYDKNSWLYKEAHDESQLYNTNNIRNWGGDFKLDNIRRSFFFTFPKKNNINVIIYTKNGNVPDVSFSL